MKNMMMINQLTSVMKNQARNLARSQGLKSLRYLLNLLSVENKHIRRNASKRVALCHIIMTTLTAVPMKMILMTRVDNWLIQLMQ